MLWSKRARLATAGLQFEPAASERRTTNPPGLFLGQTVSAATLGLASTQLAGCSSEAEQQGLSAGCSHKVLLELLSYTLLFWLLPLSGGQRAVPFTDGFLVPFAAGS